MCPVGSPQVNSMCPQYSIVRFPKPELLPLPSITKRSIYIASLRYIRSVKVTMRLFEDLDLILAPLSTWVDGDEWAFQHTRAHTPSPLLSRAPPGQEERPASRTWPAYVNAAPATKARSPNDVKPGNDAFTPSCFAARIPTKAPRILFFVLSSKTDLCIS